MTWAKTSSNMEVIIGVITSTLCPGKLSQWPSLLQRCCWCSCGKVSCAIWPCEHIDVLIITFGGAWAGLQTLFGLTETAQNPEVKNSTAIKWACPFSLHYSVSTIGVYLWHIATNGYLAFKKDRQETTHPPQQPLCPAFDNDNSFRNSMLAVETQRRDWVCKPLGINWVSVLIHHKI